MSSIDIDIRRSDEGGGLLNLRSAMDELLMSLAHLFHDGTEQIGDLLMDLVALEQVEKRGMHVQENSVESILNTLYNLANVNPTVPLNKDDIKHMRQALAEPRVQAKPAFGNTPAAMGQGVAAVQQVQPIPSSTPIHDAMKAHTSD